MDVAPRLPAAARLLPQHTFLPFKITRTREKRKYNARQRRARALPPTYLPRHCGLPFYYLLTPPAACLRGGDSDQPVN